MVDARTGWTFLTNHAAVLLTIHRSAMETDKPARVRDIAAQVGVTERTVHNVLNDLEESGYIAREHVGNRSRYLIRDDLPLRRAGDRDFAVSSLLDNLTRRPRHADTRIDEDIEVALRMLRTQLDFDVAFISHIEDGQRVFTHVDAAADPAPMEVGDRDAAEESYCHYVIDGQIPQLLTDPSQHPVASRLDVTTTLPVGTHLSVPIELNEGSDHGTCCAFSHDIHEYIDDRDLAQVAALARLVAPHLPRRPTNPHHQ